MQLIQSEFTVRINDALKWLFLEPKVVNTISPKKKKKSQFGNTSVKGPILTMH